MIKNKKIIRFHFKNKFKFEKKSPAKQRLNDMLERGHTHIDLITDWYEPMSRLSWDEVKDKFLDQVSR